jgi:hypothetical protein
MRPLKCAERYPYCLTFPSSTIWLIQFVLTTFHMFFGSDLYVTVLCVAHLKHNLRKDKYIFVVTVSFAVGRIDGRCMLHLPLRIETTTDVSLQIPVFWDGMLRPCVSNSRHFEAQ